MSAISGITPTMAWHAWEGEASAVNTMSRVVSGTALAAGSSHRGSSRNHVLVGQRSGEPAASAVPLSDGGLLREPYTLDHLQVAVLELLDQLRLDGEDERQLLSTGGGEQVVVPLHGDFDCSLLPGEGRLSFGHHAVDDAAVFGGHLLSGFERLESLAE